MSSAGKDYHLKYSSEESNKYGILFVFKMFYIEKSIIYFFISKIDSHSKTLMYLVIFTVKVENFSTFH